MLVKEVNEMSQELIWDSNAKFYFFSKPAKFTIGTTKIVGGRFGNVAIALEGRFSRLSLSEGRAA